MSNGNKYLGSKCKERIEITGEGFSMVDDDFQIVIRGAKGEKTYPKSDIIHHVEDETDEWILCYDTADFGPGPLTCIVTAFVPDTDFQGGIRQEIVSFTLRPIVNP